MDELLKRIVRAARLDVSLYEEVEADESALTQATLIVVLSSIAAGVGSIFSAGFLVLIVGTLSALIGWYIWAL